MKVGSIDDGTRDGKLVVASRDLARFVAPGGTLQAALDRWDEASPELEKLYGQLNGDPTSGERLNIEKMRSPLPRAYEWIDGSAYINHVKLVRKARGAEPPETLLSDPLVYQGGSGIFLNPLQDIPLADESWGCDFESEICVILGDTPQGIRREQADDYIKLITIANDVSLRNLIPGELQKGFGFFNSKPATAFAPFAVTPDELGNAWKDGRVHLKLRTWYNDTLFGDPDAGPEMHFSFYDLLVHITKTRAFTAGTILGSGTISNEDRSRGSSCLAEKRMIEKIDTGSITTPFMKVGDRVAIDLQDESGKTICGRIEQSVSS